MDYEVEEEACHFNHTRRTRTDRAAEGALTLNYSFGRDNVAIVPGRFKK